MCENLIEGIQRTDEHRIKFAAHNVILKEIEASREHLGKSEADPNHAVKQADFPQRPPGELFEPGEQNGNHEKVNDCDAGLREQLKKEREAIFHLRANAQFHKM